MGIKANLPLFWLALVVGGADVGLSHSVTRGLLGDWVAVFGIVGCLCTMLADKLGTYRPWQDPDRVPRPPLGPPQPPANSSSE
jgi:hypothetical protein